MPDHARDAQSAPRLHAVRVEVAAVKLGIGEDRLARDLVERDVLRRKIRRRRDDQRAADALRIADRPVERLHAAETSAHHRSPLRHADPVGQLRLRVDPVFDGDQGKVAAPRLPRGRIDGHGSGRAEAAAEVVDADDEEAIGVERFARSDHVVPPADVVGIVGVEARHVMRRVQRVADEHGIGARGIELAVRLVCEVVLRQRATAGQRERRIEMRASRLDHTHRATLRRTGALGTAGGG